MSTALPSDLLWATRGRTWGFRFLLTPDGLLDPLTAYEASFAGLPDDPTAYHRMADRVALRFPDPQGRRDASGRVIPHEFVVFGDLRDGIKSVDDGTCKVWPLVEAFYDQWYAERPPSASDDR